MVKKFRLFLVPLVILIAGLGVFVFAQSEPPPTACGDGIVQRPNDNGENEWCDDGPLGSNLCTKPSLPDDTGCGAKLLGWGWAGSFGWLSLNKANCDYHLAPEQPPVCSPLADYYVQVDVDNNLLGYAWSSNIGYICFGQTCTGTPPDGKAPRASVDLAGGEPGQEPSVYGWAKAVNLPYSERMWFSLNCADMGVCGSSNYEVRLGSDWYYPNGSTASSSQPTLIGYAWNNWDEGGGLGWIQFNPSSGIRWLQTRLGDIYARGDISSPPGPSGLFNATYRILANGDVMINLSSASGAGAPWIDPSYGPIDFPTPRTRYSNLLGKLDLAGLTCTFTSQTQTECVNRYGQTVKKVTSGDDLNLLANLGGGIYYYPGQWVINKYETGGNFVVDNPITFNNALNFNPGNGLIIINGNLVINKNIDYQEIDTFGTEKFRNLASVAWLVKGDIALESSVTEAVGAFVALGDGKTPCISCGRFNTISGAGSTDSFLTISGLVMAREFNFGRTASSPLRGSELIIYDGRLLANIPPGLGDFAQSLPIWRSSTFSP